MNRLALAFAITFGLGCGDDTTTGGSGGTGGQGASASTGAQGGSGATGAQGGSGATGAQGGSGATGAQGGGGAGGQGGGGGQGGDPSTSVASSSSASSNASSSAASSNASSNASSSASSSASGSSSSGGGATCFDNCSTQYPQGYTIIRALLNETCGCAANQPCTSACQAAPACTDGQPNVGDPMGACLSCLQTLTVSDQCAISGASNPTCQNNANCQSFVSCIIGCP